MSAESHTPSDLDGLLEGWCEGGLTPEDGERLDALLRGSAEARRYFLDALQLHSDLLWELGVREPEAEAANGIPPAPESPRLASPSVPGRTRRARRAIWLGGGLSAAAAAVLLGVGIRAWLGVRGPTDLPAAVAAVRSAENAVTVADPGGRSRRAVAGASVAAGETIRTPEDGQAQVAYGESAVIDLGPATALEFKPAAAAPADVLAQSAGAMTLKVGPRPTDRPLVLRTPHGEIRVTGTRFVSLVGPKATRVEIDEGHVRVTRFSDGRSIAIREGDYAVIGSGTEPLAPRSAPITLTEAAHMLDGGPDQYLVDLAITADGSTMIAGHAAGSVAFWDLAAGRVRRVIETRMKDLRCLALSPDGRRLALGTLRGQMRLWDVATGEPAAPAADPSNHLAALTFCDGGALVAATGRVREARGLRSVVRLWRTESGRREADLPCGDAVLRSLAASPDGGLLAAGDEQGVMTLWDARQRGPLHRFQAHDDTVSSIAFSPDGRWLATGGHDGTIRLWDPATRDARATLKGHAARVLALAFCPDRMLLASADQYGIARLWDLRTAREVVGFVRVKWRESRIAFLPDGRVLVTAAGTDKIRLWDVPQEVLESSATWGGR